MAKKKSTKVKKTKSEPGDVVETEDEDQFESDGEEEAQYLFDPTKSAAHESPRDAIARHAHQQRLRLSEEATAAAAKATALADEAERTAADNADALRETANDLTEKAKVLADDVAPKPEPMVPEKKKRRDQRVKGEDDED